MSDPRPERTSVYARLGEYARPYRRDFAIGFAMLAATNALAVSIPWILRTAVHELEADSPLANVAGWAGVMALVAIVQAWARTRSRLRILGASRRIAFDVRERFFAKLQTLSASWFDAHRTGDIMSRGVNDLQLLQSLFGPGLMNLLNTGLIYVAVLALMLRLDPLLTGAALVLFPPLYFAVNRLSRGVYTRSLAVQEQLAAISNRAQENLSGIQQVKIFAQEDRESDEFRSLCEEFRRRNLALARRRALMMALIGVFAGCGTVLVLGLGGSRVMSGALTFGDFVAFNAYFGLLAWPTIALGWIVNVFQRGAGALVRVDEVLRAVPDVPASPNDRAVPLTGDIEFRDLTFAYPGSTRPVLNGISLSIARGARVAVVGAVGSGKSTLAHLLARIYPAAAGTIFVGGVDVTTVSPGRVRRTLGFVPQEAFLYSRRVRDNVVLGRPDADERDVARAIAIARLDADVGALPRGLDTIVGERGFTLSGGQRQRVALARALLVEPEILVLDDALAAVDAETERTILDRLGGRTGGGTLVIITHRLSTLAGVDRIVVLEDGRVVEDGSHETLLALDGTYARLFARDALERRLDQA